MCGIELLDLEVKGFSSPALSRPTIELVPENFEGLRAEGDGGELPAADGGVTRGVVVGGAVADD